MASWGRSLWHRPSSVQHQLGTLPSDTPGPVTSSPGPQAFTARTTDRPSALLPDSLPPDALPAGGAGWGRAWASAGRPPPGARGRAGGRVGPPIPEPHASPGLFSPESLSELREYSEGLGEPTGADDCVPPAAGQSVISLLSSKELQQLIEEVRVLDEATLKQLDSIHVTVLHKEEGAGLGFSLAGGADLENKVVTVHRVFPSGLASREGTIQKGNEVLSINGKSLKGATHNDALAILRQARDPRQAVIVTRKPTLEATPDLSPTTDSAASTSGAGDVSAESGKFSQWGGACGACRL
ncbi:pro-interleukin-16-like isoform X2 [Pteropus vampyrus]|uniref:Pro-interleukin-16 n=1 Tax=Pteropus vampyrus TaxID=132908 RepID=A0A6P6BLA1_PTEVA|nr:pro-interleukin-16-like isoform X2 [Pteropus vampyrus]